MLAAVLMLMGGGSALLAFLDWGLDNKSKDRISGLVLNVWNWLDDLKKISLLKYLRTKGILIALSVGLTLSMLALYVSGLEGVLPETSALYDVPISPLRNIAYSLLAVALLVGAVGGWVLIRKVTSYDDYRKVVKVSLVVLLLSAIAACLNYSTAGPFLSTPHSAVTSIMIGIFEIVLTIFTISVFYMTAIVLIPYLLIFLSIVLIFSVEAVVRKVAEAPNGVLLAAGGILSTLGLFMKSVLLR